MARIKRAQIRKTRTKKLFARAKGFFSARKNTRRQAHQAVMKAKAYAFAGRKQKKRAFRQLWITRIGAATKQRGMSYSQFMHGLTLMGSELNRKQLSELAIHEPTAFDALVEQAQAAVAQAAAA
ncbi:MAG: 50S ribosomal protein L20 [Alphaproteobacteria bacterium]|nr:50S ribosomal protein L20 [Alphaproteobacteria bacterium]